VQELQELAVLTQRDLVRVAVAVAQMAVQMVTMELPMVAVRADCTEVAVDQLQVTHHLQGLAQEAQ
jgi:hypothetical protein